LKLLQIIILEASSQIILKYLSKGYSLEPTQISYEDFPLSKKFIYFTKMNFSNLFLEFFSGIDDLLVVFFLHQMKQSFLRFFLSRFLRKFVSL
jgi:hypothetical protein